VSEVLLIVRKAARAGPGEHNSPLSAPWCWQRPCVMASGPRMPRLPCGPIRNWRRHVEADGVARGRRPTRRAAAPR